MVSLFQVCPGIPYEEIGGRLGDCAGVVAGRGVCCEVSEGGWVGSVHAIG